MTSNQNSEDGTVEANIQSSTAGHYSGPVGQISRKSTKTATITELLRARAGKLLCCWGTVSCSVKKMWADLTRELGTSLASKIMKVKSVTQRSDGRIRFDVIVEEDAAAKVLAKARGSFPHCFLREHIAYHVRSTKAVKISWTPKGTVNDQVVFALASFNIQTATADRKLLVEDRLFEQEIDVLALQEHMRTEKDAPVRVGGYITFSVPAAANQDLGKGQRGVALLVRKHIACSEVYSCDHFILVRAVLNGCTFLLGSAYFPQGVNAKKKVMKTLKSALKRESSTAQRVIILGDFNLNKAAVDKMILELEMKHLVRVELAQPDETWHGCFTAKKKWSCIDHILMSPELKDRVSGAAVDRSWSFSDHFATTMDLKVDTSMSGAADSGDAEPSATRAPRLRMEQIDEVREHIRTHNKFGALLLELEEEQSVDALKRVTDEFMTENVRLMTEAAGQAPRKDKTRNRKGHLPKALKKMVQLRSSISGDVMSAITMVRTNPTSIMAQTRLKALRGSYHKVDDELRVALKEFRKEEFAAHVRSAVEFKEKNDARSLWRWCYGLAGLLGSRPKLSPVQGANGKLLMDRQAIKTAWVNYTTGHAEDKTGHSRSAAYWENILPRATDAPGIAYLNRPITWREVECTLRALAVGKAPGASGITTDWLVRCAIDDKEHDEPQSSFGKCVFALVRTMVEKACIPESQRASVLLHIPKKGKDVTLMSNYRGISLPEAVLKVADTLVQRRLSHVIETKKLVCMEQGAFRRLEEVASQVVALFEVIERRRQQGQSTYVAFLDYAAAFDNVPHEALFRKLENRGVGGMVLNFVKAMYANAVIRLRLGDNISNDLIELQRGVRQGGATSPILFNIFINDLFEELSGVTAVTVPGSDQRLAGLYFADDVAALAEDRPKLQKALRRINKWSRKWEMSLNVDKCKVVLFHGTEEEHDVLQQNPVVVNGEALELVSEFEYLGVRARQDFDLKEVARARAAKLDKSLFMLRPILKSSNIPIDIKLTVLKGAVLPKALFSGELYGGDKLRCNVVQASLNKYLQLIGVGSEKAKCATTVLWRELDVPPIYALASVARMRLYLKAPNMSTWFHHLSGDKYRNAARGQAWFAKTAWLRSHQLKCVPENASPSELLKRAQEILWDTYECTGRNKALVAAVAYETMRESRMYIETRVYKWEEIVGKAILMKMRIGAYSAAARAATFKLHSKWRTKCPCCLDDVPETLEHLLWSCPKWQEQRVELRSAMVKALGGDLSLCALPADFFD